MPTCRRKRVVLVEPSAALLDAAARGIQTNVYYLEQTGEIFTNYEYACPGPSPRTNSSTDESPTRRDYAARMTFYRTKQFQCEVTGKSSLSYFEALESELQEARTMHSRFPEPLKSAILRSVQFRTSALC
jgi:bromodomain adjacent to zinc finger domain protein 1A